MTQHGWRGMISGHTGRDGGDEVVGDNRCGSGSARKCAGGDSGVGIHLILLHDDGWLKRLIVGHIGAAVIISVAGVCIFINVGCSHMLYLHHLWHL